MLSYGREIKVIVLDKNNESIELSNVRISFRIIRNTNSEANDCEISFYNLNSDSTSFLEKNELKIIVMCGYRKFNDDLKVIFEGEITNSVSTKIGTERVTTVYAGDADTGINISQYQRTYRANTKIKDIIVDIAESMKTIVMDENITHIPNDQFINAYTSVGSTKKTLDNLFKKINLEWYVDNNVFYAKPRVRIEFTNAFVISSQTGMIGTPYRKNIKNVSSNITESGVSFNSILNPELVPGSTVNIQSQYANVETQGLFLIKETVFEGDTHGNNWFSKCLCLGDNSA